MMENRYNKLNSYLKNKFGERTLKICIDGHFTCPNRDGTLGKNGCIFCSEKGSGEHLLPNIDIKNQVTSQLNGIKSKRANKFIAYFQNFSNTYDMIENLREKYNAALIDDRIVGLAIATRPDCINQEIANLLKTYTSHYQVWVELGLQTSNETIGKFLHLGYTNQQFTNAVSMLNKAGIDVIVHLMIGLPKETPKDIENTVKFINTHPIQGIKVHSTYIVKNTILEKLYQERKISTHFIELLFIHVNIYYYSYFARNCNPPNFR